MLRRVGIGAGEQEAVVGVVTAGRPHLLAVDHPLVAVEHRRRLQAGEVGSRVGLAEALAPAHLAAEDLRQEVLLLLLGPPLQDRRPDERVAEEVGAHRRLGPGELLGEHDALHRRQALAAVLLGPRGADPPAAVQLLRPLGVEPRPLLVGHLEALVEPAGRQVVLQPGPDLLAERLGLGGVGQVHGHMLTRPSARISTHEGSTSRAAGSARRPRRRRPPRHGLLHGRTPTPPIQPSRSPSARRGIAVRASRRRSTRTTSSPRHRRSASTGPRRASTVRCSSGATPTPCPSRRGRARWRCSSPTTSPCSSTPPTATRRRPPCPTPSSRANRGRLTGSGLADGIVVTPSHNPPSDGGFKYNPPHGGPADTDATGWIAGSGQRAARRRPGRRAANAARHGRGSRPSRTTSSATLRRRPARRRRRRRHPRRRRARRRRSARRGQRRLLGGDRRAPPPRPDRRQPGRRSDVAVHDARLGRQDPHGLLVAGRHGVVDRSPRRVPGRHGQRRRRRPPRHRHPGCRADEPQPLPGRRHRLPLRQPRRAGRRRRPSARRSCRRR